MKIKGITTIASVMMIFPIPSSADVFDALTNDLSIPAGIYDTTPANILNIQLQTVISTGNCEIGDYTGCTLNDVNNDTNIDPGNKFKPEIKVRLQADDFANDGLASNATLRQRGGYSRFADQKSYRIKLDSKNNLWRNQRKLQLNKHPWDVVRVRNKLSFDLMKDIPHLPSLNSQFVKLDIDGVSHGIYTHIENVGKEYLINRGWDKDSGLYKAKNFSFRQRTAYNLDTEGKPLNKDAFERRMDIKRGKNHTKFVEMLAAVNNSTNNFQTEVLDKYFNRNNYLAWMAVNILTGNLDVSHSNFYLYNPKGSDDFYFLPWDYDDTWGIEEQPDNVAEGTTWDKNQFNPQALWSSKFHQRFLEQPNSLNLLAEAVTLIKNDYFTTQKVQALLDSYSSIIPPRLKDDTEPDFYNLPTSISENNPDSDIRAEYDLVYSQLLARVQQNYNRFIAEKESPMPFDLEIPTFENGDINLIWNAAFDPQGDPIHYDLDVATTPDFQAGTIKLSVQNITVNTYSKYWEHPAGNYYYRVVARDNANHWQNSNESYTFNEGKDNEKTYHNSFHFTAPEGTPLTSLSNLITLGTITYDGILNEWTNLQSFGTDPADINGTSGNEVDWRQAWMGHDVNGNIYFANSYDKSINMTWGHLTYMDTDQSKTTGYIGGSNNLPIGVDYMIQGYHLWKYTGTGTSWSWSYVTPLWYSWNGLNSEMTTQLYNIGNPSKIDVFFEGNNAPYGNNTSDFYPDDAMSAGKYFTYSLTP
ncbi:MAG: CotH kinase family protein [Cocleimonas sp.]|nr:CotH kinase family protein [Cocleimonas sp.]